jgi:hypothetical protein
MRFAIVNLFLTALSLPVTHAALLRQGHYPEESRAQEAGDHTRGLGKKDSKKMGGKRVIDGQNVVLDKMLKKMDADVRQGKPLDMNEFKEMKQMVKESLNIDPKQKELKDVALTVFERDKDKNLTKQELVVGMVAEMQNQEVKNQFMIDLERGCSSADESATIDPHAGEDHEYYESDDDNDSGRLLGVPKKAGGVWPNGVIKYHVVVEYDYSGYYSWQRRILPAMIILEETTNISFEFQGYVFYQHDAKDDGTLYLQTGGTGCWTSEVGYQGPNKKTVLAIGGQCCVHTPDTCYPEGKNKNGIFLQVLLRVAGFAPQTNAAYRDKYITLHEENMWDYGIRATRKLQNDHGAEAVYDYGSIMHYGEWVYTKNGRKTIDCGGNPCGQQEGLSYWDIIEINYYNLGNFWYNSNLE